VKLLKLNKLLEEIKGIADCNEADKIEVAVEGWDDNFYDGDKIEGIRLVNNRDYDQGKIETVLFIITGRGR
jgi:hypothetical protein